ncbi:MAG: YdbH domain-containing protein [Gammaproteobacteria bacterium]|nr:YdbH domain-containing protein [Gammaproteobacteria bacterium]
MSTPSISKKPLSTLSRLIVGIITLCLLVGALLSFFTGSLLVRISNPFLAPAGVELRSIEGLRFRRENLSAQSINFTFVDGDGVSSTTRDSTLENLTVTFSLVELLKGQLETIEIEALTLNFPKTQTSAEPGAGTAIDMTQWLATLQSLPLRTLSIERFSVADNIKDAAINVSRNTREIATRVRHDDLSLDLLINWHDDEFVSSYFIPEDQLAAHHFPPQTITGSLTIESNEERVFDGEFTVSESAGEIRADSTGTLQLGTGGRLLRRLQLLPETLSNLEGSVYFSGSAQGRTLPPDDQTLTLTLTLLAGSSVQGTVPTPPNGSETTIQWHATDALTISGAYASQSASMTFETADQSVQATLQTGSTTHVATLAITQASGECSLPLRCSIQLSSALNLPTLAYENFALADISANSSMAIAFDNTTIDVTLEQGSRIGASFISGPDFSLGQANLLIQESMTISTDEVGEATLKSNGVELFLPEIRLGTDSGYVAVKASDLQGRWSFQSDTPPQLSAQLDARSLGSDQLPFQFRKPEITARLELSNNNLSVNGRLLIADRDILSVEGNVDLNSTTAQIHAQIPRLQFGPGQQTFAQLFLDIPVEADIIAGSVAASADIAVRMNDTTGMQVSGPVQLNVDRLSGFYINTAVVDFSTDISGELLDSGDFVSEQALQGRIANVNPGLPVENISFNYGVDTRRTTLDLHDLQATIFNGALRSEGVAYNWAAAENTFTMVLERVDLSTLLDMGAYEGVQASGIISGNVPVTISGGTVSVAEGTLHVEAPGGSIRYQPANAGGSGNAALDLVNQALSNYQYDSLEADVNYLPSGDLNLAVRLQGANPDMNQGQRINLNLNISDNIPSLLQSLQSGRSITDALERALQNR